MSTRPPLPRARALLAALFAITAVLVAAAAGSASSGAPPGAARDLAQTYFSNTLTRAEVVSVVGRVVHDYRLDEGRVIAVRRNAIDLLERDGTRQTIALSPSTRISGVGRLFGGPVARGVRVVAVRDGGGPATLIRPSAYTRVLGKIMLGTTLVRAEVLTYSAGTPHDFRIDEGRIVSVNRSTSTIVLLERDGTKQTIAFTSSTLISEVGQQVDQNALTKGLTAITVREGDGPAVEIRLFSQFLAGPR